MEEWHSEAACLGLDGAVDFIVVNPSKGRGSNQDRLIREYCDRCPVVKECGDFALSLPRGHVYGIWGGVYIPPTSRRPDAFTQLEDKSARLSRLGNG